jgi:hypothetical protein
MRARWNASALLVPALLLVLPLGSACMGDDEEEDERPLHTRCDLAHAGDELSGEWSLTAEGKRRRCEDADFEGELSIETSEPIEVVSQPQAGGGDGAEPTPDAIADAFVERIERAEHVLSLGTGAPDGLSLAGGTVGSCMSVTLTEELPGGDALVYELDGAITDRGFAEGDFSGEGPAGCIVEGTFELVIR